LLLSVGVGCDAGAAEVVAGAGAVGISVGAGTLMGKGRAICCEESFCDGGGGGKRGVTRGAAQGGSGTRVDSTLNGSSTVHHMNYSISNPKKRKIKRKGITRNPLSA
jgi:hypothetical protein